MTRGKVYCPHHRGLTDACSQLLDDGTLIPMAYPRSALAFILLLAGCPGEGSSSSSDTGTSTGSTPTSAEGSEGPCPGGGSPCGSECVFLGSDPNNCGACGNVCEAGVECIGAQCLDTDPCDGMGYPCNGVCVDLDNDNNNCGDCGNQCEAPEVCNGEGNCMAVGNDSTTTPGTDTTPPDTTTDGTTSSGTTSGGTTSGTTTGM